MAKKVVQKSKNKGGRPTAYKSEFVDLAYNYALLGATDDELATFFSVEVRTIHRWKESKPEFCHALKRGKEIADAEIASKLFHRARGYSHPEDKIFNNNGDPLVVPTIKHYPPDTTAAIFWLKNRQPRRFRDKQEHIVAGDQDSPIKQDLTIKIIKSDTPFAETEEDID